MKSGAVALIPDGVAAGMLAGVLLPFCLKGAGAAQSLPALVLPMIAVFVLVRLKNPALAVLAALGLGLTLAFTLGGAVFPPLTLPEMFAQSAARFAERPLVDFMGRAFTYAALHLMCYAWFDMGFDLADTLQDLFKRPFIWLGFSAFVILWALAATSFNRAVRWLGGKRWQMLHRGVYAVAVLAVLHFWWMRAGKQDFAEVLVYAGILVVLLGWRLLRRSARRP